MEQIVGWCAITVLVLTTTLHFYIVLTKPYILIILQQIQIEINSYTSSTHRLLVGLLATLCRYQPTSHPMPTLIDSLASARTNLLELQDLRPLIQIRVNLLPTLVYWANL